MSLLVVVLEPCCWLLFLLLLLLDSLLSEVVALLLLLLFKPAVETGDMTNFPPETLLILVTGSSAFRTRAGEVALEKFKKIDSYLMLL